MRYALAIGVLLLACMRELDNGQLGHDDPAWSQFHEGTVLWSPEGD